MSAFRDARNEAALKRLRRALPDLFPQPVLAHALARPFVPPTPRRAIESYWRHHPLRAEALARALARRSGTPEGWVWRLDAERKQVNAGSFRAPPAPYRETPFHRGAGHCCICGQPVFRFGWHRDLWGDGKPNARAAWHSACVVAWQFWAQPSAHAKLLRKVQGRRCPVSGSRLLKTSEVDHRLPLHRVWREHRELSWPDLLGFWGRPNLQVVNREHHRAKSAEEAGERAARRRNVSDSSIAPDPFILVMGDMR